MRINPIFVFLTAGRSVPCKVSDGDRCGSSSDGVVVVAVVKEQCVFVAAWEPLCKHIQTEGMNSEKNQPNTPATKVT